MMSHKTTQKEGGKPPARFRFFLMRLNMTLVGLRKQSMKFADLPDCTKHKFTNGVGTKRRNEARLKQNFTPRLMNSGAIPSMASARWNQLPDP